MQGDSDMIKAIEQRDFKKIERLNQLDNPETFWDEVKGLTKGITSSHSIGRWQCLAEQRYTELCEETNKQNGRKLPLSVKIEDAEKRKNAQINKDGTENIGINM